MADLYARLNPIMDSMVCVYAHLKKNSFTAIKELSFNVALGRVKTFLKLSESEAALFTFIFVNYFDYGEKPVSAAMLSQDASTNSLRLLGFRAEFNALEEKGYIYADSIDEPVSFAKYYRIPDGLTDAIVKNDASLLQKGLYTRDRDLTYPDEITEKTLFYSEDVQKDVDSLETYLEKTHFTAIQARLSDKALPRGVCIMLHGDSGTGKTETVFQLARKTNRALLHIDIGQTISVWHGGTERNLSLLFERYERLCKQAELRGDNIPILLFNEADALFGRRMERPTQGSEIDENHIQSVLLDYLEKQKGIVIATTNLAGNFDDAFERRFLFKIKFEKPDLSIKQKIWHDKAAWLKKPAALHLAESYSLTGAEIENVVRKATMKEVLTGKKSTLAELEDYCKKEKLSVNHSKRIGFSR